MKLARGIVKHKLFILILALALCIPSIFGMAATRINYDMLTYLPEDMDTVIGQDELMEDFGKGAFSLIVIENMTPQQVSDLHKEIEKVDHVDSVIWYDSIMDVSVPMELLPDNIYNAFNSGNATLMAVFFDSSTSADVTMDAVAEIRRVCGENCFVAGMSALVLDLKNLCEKEEPIYVTIAVLMAAAAMMLFLDSYLAPFVFLACIGIMVLINMGTNIFLGEISYITKALSAVLQLAVTMDYSIFLWHSYNEQLLSHPDDHAEAMAIAIHNTFASVLGSSITTVAGFIALCFMSFTMGRDLGIVMAKGVILGVLGCVTVLPALILLLDKPLQKTMHRSLIPNTQKFSEGLLKIVPVILILFILVIPPAYYGYDKTNDEVYYDMGECLPQDIDYVIANSKLRDEFDIASTHMLLVDADTSEENVRAMIDEMEQVDGVKYVLGLESVIGSSVPMEIIPDSVKEILESDRWKLMLINSEYKVASDAVNDQIDALNRILKTYDAGGMLIGEAPCMKDLIETTGHDFAVVNAVSIALVFLIIFFVEKSLTLPILLISVIEVAIFINLGLPHYLGTSLPFIAPIAISTIQLGATVDYAILMTTRYKDERIGGANKHDAVWTALYTSIPSIIVSGMGLFAATFGVALYSNIDIVSSMCMLLARAAIVSMICVIFVLPALLAVFDGIICRTTIGMKQIRVKEKAAKVMKERKERNAVKEVQI
ncbi:MAG: MMPL family transporter [Lachnospiraceae bacterium]|nr:MMPL family transporter [Lachnospiraceae bacterium]